MKLLLLSVALLVGVANSQLMNLPDDARMFERKIIDMLRVDSASRDKDTEVRNLGELRTNQEQQKKEKVNEIQVKVVELVNEVQKMSNEAEGSSELAKERGMDLNLLRDHIIHNHRCSNQSQECADSKGLCLISKEMFHRYCHPHNSITCGEGCYCCHTDEVTGHVNDEK